MPRLIAPGLEAPDSWQWIEPPWDKKVILPEPLNSMVYLYNKMYLRATYKILNGKHVRLRIYIIPEDVEGRRFLPPSQQIIKKRLRDVLILINTSSTAWEGQVDAPFEPLLKPPPEQHITLSDIFNQISAGTEREVSIDDPENEEIIKNVMTGYVEGMKSTLYPYQRETVVEMIRKELVPVQMADPRITEIRSPTGRIMYLDTDTCAIRLYPDFFEGAYGGVLSEDMGFGKTCICIALICATKYQGSRLPDNETIVSTPTLTTLALSKICALTINRHGLPWLRYKSKLPNSCIELLNQNRVSYVVEDSYMSRRRTETRRRGEAIKHRRIILSGTTLIICPDALQAQWYGEIQKHVSHGYLNVLYHNARELEDSSVVDYNQYDVILMTQRRFGLESKRDSSPLHEIHWKRIIVDEGHSMSSSQTLSVAAVKALRVDRKWAVTGTPVPGLLGVDVGTDSVMSTGSGRQSVPMHTKTALDLARLGHLIADFLGLPPWNTNPTWWQRYCSGPFLDKGRYEIVERVLRQVMVRHRRIDLEVDIHLPKLTHTVILVEPSLFNKLNINLFHAFVAVNAVTSDRKDQDYLFHRNNRMQLRRLVTNLQHSTFYWTGFSIEDVQLMIDVATKCMEKNKYSEEDKSVLRLSILAGKRALSNDEWTFSSKFHEMGYFLNGIPGEINTQLLEVQSNECSGIMSGQKILNFQNLMGQHKRRDADGNLTDAEIVKLIKLTSGDEVDAKSKGSITGSKSQKGQRLKSNSDNKGLPGVPSHTTTQERTASTQSHKYFSSHSYDDIATRSNLRLTADSRFKNCNIRGCFSSKLTYLLSRIRDLHEKEKIIIFYEFDDVAFYIGEALEIMSINHCFYTTALNSQARATNLMTFNTTEIYRVMLMDLGLASHGLNVTGASRIIFINPVWQPNIEAQAMRRAHRIGQMRPVHVETLILRGTIEEAIYNRRRAMTQDEFAAAKTLTDDAPMNRIISDPQFIETEDHNSYGQYFDPPVYIFGKIEKQIDQNSKAADI
ncbi:SNF2 family N-terminal domain-containing protein [Dipodascopsis uninucleata]